jgi:hypothetical protein
VLGDESFPAFGQRIFVEGGTVAADLPADADDRRLGAGENPLERLAALGEGAVAPVLASFFQHVEHDVGHGRWRVRGAGAGRSREVNAALELLESGGPPLRVERDDLAVERQGSLQPAAPRGQSRGNFRKLRRLLVSQPGPQLHAGRCDLRDGPDAVVLRLVNQLRIVERGVHQ